MTTPDGFFEHGGEYDRITGIPRKTCCGTCAFKEGPGTVRPEGVTVADVEAASDFMDDFICHTPNEDGSNPSCAGWHSRQGQNR